MDTDIFGIDATRLEWYQMTARAVLVFTISLIYIRVPGLIRSFSGMTAFDQLTALLLGSILGRSVVTTDPFFESLLAALVIVLLHRFVSYITFKSHKAGLIIKGDRILVCKDGVLQMENMGKAHVTREDILEAMHLEANKSDLSLISKAYVERSGGISIILKDD